MCHVPVWQPLLYILYPSIHVTVPPADETTNLLELLNERDHAHGEWWYIGWGWKVRGGEPPYNRVSPSCIYVHVFSHTQVQVRLDNIQWILIDMVEVTVLLCAIYDTYF